jgi:hypothetical protein
MRNTSRAALIAVAASALLAACAQPVTTIRALPAGPTSEEVGDYAIAQARYRAAKASGNGDIVMRSNDTFSSISQEILYRQDPNLIDAWVVCERYRMTGPHDPRGVRSTFEPQLVQHCGSINRRYNAATSAIRRDLDARIAADDQAIITQAASGRP